MTAILPMTNMKFSNYKCASRNHFTVQIKTASSVLNDFLSAFSENIIPLENGDKLSYEEQVT